MEYGTPCTLLEDAPEQTVEVLFEKEVPSPSNGCETTTTPRGHVTVTQVSLRQICCYSTNNMDQKARETGATYENGTITEETSFVIPLKSFRIQSLQEHEIRVVTRYDTVMTARKLTRHISGHYGPNPDLYLVVNGTPLKDWDRISSEDGQVILLKTRLRGGMRRSSRAPAKLDVTKELCTIRQREPLNHMGQQEEDRQTRIRMELRKLRHRMWSQHHPLRSEMDRLLSTTGPISEDDLKILHHRSTECSTRPLLQRGLFCQDG